MTETETVAPENTIYDLDPALILADDNARFNLKPSRVDRLASEIEAHGGVHTPVEVEVLEKPIDGKEYRLTVGYYRHAAVTKLNTETKAGLTLPCIARNPADSTARLKRQLSENVDRESLSPMDQAVAIDKLLKAGVSRLEIRTIFARPSGKTMAPASNAWVNIIHRMLELPKSIQDKIHNGLVGIQAAYELSKVSPDRREAVLERALADRQAELDAEAKDEAKFLADEQKAQALAAKAEEAEKAAEAAKVEAELAEKRAAKIEQELKGIKAPGKKDPAKVKKAHGAKLQKLRGELSEAEKAAATHTKAVEKFTETAKSLAQKAADRLKAITEGKAATKKKAAPVSPQAVKKAAAQDNKGTVALNAAQMRSAIKELEVVSYPTVTAIGRLVLDCFNGVSTPAQLLRALAELVKEPNLPKPRAKK